MAVLPTDLIAPNGEIEPTLFDDEDEGGSVLERVTAAIDALAVSNPSATDAAVTAYTYYRLFSAKAGALADTPTSMSADGVSQSWSYSQIQFYDNKARWWKAQYDAATDTATVPAPPRSRSVRPGVYWG